MNLSDELQLLEQELLALLPILKEYITTDDEKLLREFITHCECGLAYEEIVETIKLHKIPISQEQYADIIKVGLKMEFEENDWNKIKHLIKRGDH